MPSEGVAPSVAVKKIKNKNMGAPEGASAYAAYGGDKKMSKKISGASGAPIDFKGVTCSTRIQNMSLVLKSDNGEVVSIANEQNHRRT